MSQLVLRVWIATTVILVLRAKAQELRNETLVITAYERFLGLYIDDQMQSLTNGGTWNLPDYIQLLPTNRLIAVEAANLAIVECGGVLASVYDGSLLTNSEWKCTSFDEVNWANLGFDDSNWPNAIEYGSNGNHSNCSQQQLVEDISSNSKWIWTSNLGDFAVYCRGYLPFCENSSPCLNNGICLRNDERFCECLPGFTGTQCETALQNETLVVTAYEYLTELYIDGEEQSAANGNNWNRSDYIGLPPMSRLIALKANNSADPLCAGVLASTLDVYALTNSNSWRCTASNDDVDWILLGFNDSSWSYATEYDSNVEGHRDCTQGLQLITDIDPNAQWIWTSNPSDSVVYCRGYLPFCEYRSPCLNNGTCLQNNKTFCKCLPQYTGQFCESEIPTTAQTTESFTTEITAEFTTEETITLYTSDVETLFTTMNDISTDFTETTGVEDTTEYISTEDMGTTEPPETTDGLSTSQIETTESPETTVYFSSDNAESTYQAETTEYLSTDNAESTHPAETTEYLSTDNAESTDQAETTEYLSTDNAESTDQAETTTYLSSDNTEITPSLETTDNTETTQTPEPTETTIDLETAWTSETSASTEGEETTAFNEHSTDSETSQITLEATTTEWTEVSDVRQTTDTVPGTATTAEQTIGSSKSTADQTTSHETDFTASTWFSQADNSSNTLPAIYGECPEELYCDGPVEKPGSSIDDCFCPSGYLSLNNNCCMSQNWIIGLTCISVGIVIGIIVTIVACLRCRRPPDNNSDRLSLSGSRGGSLMNGGGSLINGKAIAVTESSLVTGSEPPAVDMNGHVDYYHDNEVEAAKSNSNENMYTTQLTESHMGLPEWDPAEKEQVRQDAIFNPLMVELLSNDTYRQFRPSLESVSTDVDFTIQRPSIQLPSGPYNNFYDPNDLRF